MGGRDDVLAYQSTCNPTGVQSLATRQALIYQYGMFLQLGKLYDPR